MTRKRNEDGSYAQEITHSDITAAMREHAPHDMTTAEIAEACECSTQTARRRLKDLEDRNQVASRTTSDVVLWWLR